jgi:hypothetical protein
MQRKFGDAQAAACCRDADATLLPRGTQNSDNQATGTQHAPSASQTLKWRLETKISQCHRAKLNNSYTWSENEFSGFLSILR